MEDTSTNAPRFLSLCCLIQRWSLQLRAENPAEAVNRDRLRAMAETAGAVLRLEARLMSEIAFAGTSEHIADHRRLLVLLASLETVSNQDTATLLERWAHRHDQRFDRKLEDTIAVLKYLPVRLSSPVADLTHAPMLQGSYSPAVPA